MRLTQAAQPRPRPPSASRPAVPVRSGGRIKDSSVEQVKAAADMAAIVSARTQLRRVGSRYLGRCPFHDERTPSFSVNTTDKLYYCFGCGAKGDLITFVRETEHLDFVGAIEWLADRFNVPLEYEEISPEQDARRRRRDRLLELLDAAARYYERYLCDSPAGALAREYLAGRSLGEDVCREYRLGLAPGGRTLTRKAREKGFTPAELSAAGLANRRGNDYFSRRLLFPLADARGRVVGFQARKLYDDDPLHAKYVNSPEGELFRKGDILYGLDHARVAIARENRALVVEGNPDVLALRQAGLEPVVAAMGTALTEGQLKELGRLTKRLWLCFDGDAAGEAATLRGMELAVRAGFAVQVLTLPPGTDPADLAEGFERRLADAENFMTYRVRVEVARAADRQSAFVAVQEFLTRCPDSIQREEAKAVATDLLGLPRDLQAGLAPRTHGAEPGRAAVSVRVIDADERRERDALAGVLAHPELRSVLADLGPEHFDSSLHRELRELLLDGDEDRERAGPLLAELDARAAADGIDERTARELLLRLRERHLRRELAAAEGERLLDLQQALAKVRSAFRELA
jgi:DNA primase